MYKTLTQKTLVWLLLITIVITMAASIGAVTGNEVDVLWKQWFILPLSFGILYIIGKCYILNLILLV